jgi:propanediol dehydratase small subunit
MTKPTRRYPLIEHAADELRAASGRALHEIILDAAAAGKLTITDTQISAETLRAQADIARHAGYTQLAENLARAAELTSVPNDQVLQMYDLLRPGRASHADMIALVEQLEQVYLAPLCAALVREAAAIYQQRGLLRNEASEVRSQKSEG